jgi:hypothetical protein
MNSEALEGCLSPAEREELDAHFLAIHQIMCRKSWVCLSAGWRPFKGTLADGREVTHKFKVDGHVRSTPAVR